MSGDKQTQNAGDNAQQMQAGTMVVNNYYEGISEQRAREIANEQIQYALEKYSKEAYEKGVERILKFLDRLITKITQIENALQAFAEPAFLIFLRDAQESAASTDQEEDYDLLAELLACHIKEGKDRKQSSAIHQAVKIVSEIDNDALCGLTAAHIFINFMPGKGSCQEGLTIMNKHFCKLLYQDLPIDYYWLDRLDILRAVRIMPMGYTKKGVFEYYSQHTGYICVGIKENSEIHKKAIDILESARISRCLLLPNEFLDGYLRLPLNDEKSVNEGAFATEKGNIPFSNEHKQAFKQVLSMYAHDPHLQKQVQQSFIKKWDSFESLHRFRLWWETIPHAFEITSVGSILAHTNAKRCDPELPDLIINWEKQT